MRRLFNHIVLLALIYFGASDVRSQRAFPYMSGKDCYKLVELEGFMPDETADVWDLSRASATGVESPLIFKMIDDSTFTATTDNARQTFRIKPTQWYLLKSEAMISVAELAPGVIVKGTGCDTIELKGRTYQTDHYNGKGSTNHETIGRGKLIRQAEDTISNVTLDRRITTLKIGISHNPFDSLEAISDTAQVYSKTTVWTWRRSNGKALAQTIEQTYSNSQAQSATQSIAYFIIDESKTVEYQHRQQSSAGTTVTATIGNEFVTISGLEQDFDDTQITVSDISGRVYCHKVMNSGGGIVTIHTPLPPDQIVISIIQTTQTNLKIAR